MCEPSFYRGLVSCDTIWHKMIGGQLLAGKRDTGYKRRKFLEGAISPNYDIEV